MSDTLLQINLHTPGYIFIRFGALDFREVNADSLDLLRVVAYVVPFVIKAMLS